MTHGHELKGGGMGVGGGGVQGGEENGMTVIV